MIKLKNILLEHKTHEEILLDFIREKIQATKFEGKVFVAGGYVRDMVMGKKSKDIDITVALPNGGIEFAEWITKKDGSYKEGSNPVSYPKFGTSKFNLKNTYYNGQYLGDIDIESVMTRKEQYHEGDRKPDTSFGTPYEDVERRDLTINSLLYDISNKKILDLTGKGIDDIKNKIIRTPIEANIIFKEDPLRMLRAIRFAVRYGWELSPEMINSLNTNAGMLKTISKERIQDEFNKILLSDIPSNGIRYLIDTNLMKYIIPEYYELIGMAQNEFHQWDVYEHTLRVLDNSPKRIEVRLGALFHDLGKIKTKTVDNGKVHFYKHEDVSAEIAENSLKDLKYPLHIIKRVYEIVKHHMRTKSYGNELESVSDKALRKLMNDMGEHLEDLLDLVNADNISHGDPGWKYNLEKQVDLIRIKLKQLGDFTGKLVMPVDGNKIMQMLNMKPGKEVGMILTQFKEEFLGNPEKINNMSDSEIESLIKQIYSTIQNKENIIKLKKLI